MTAAELALEILTAHRGLELINSENFYKLVFFDESKSSFLKLFAKLVISILVPFGFLKMIAEHPSGISSAVVNLTLFF